MITFENDVIEVDFASECGGLPSRIAVKYPEGTLTVFHTETSPLVIKLADGRIVTPFLPENYPVLIQEKTELKRYHFDRLGFRDQYGKTVEGYYLSLRYEFYDDGTTFVQSFFISENYENPAGINSFKYEFPLDFSDFSHVEIPYGVDASLASRSGEENIPFHSYTEKGIKQNFNFNCKRKNGLGGYFEIFMEDARSLDHTEENKATEIKWNGNSPCISWEFQSKEAAPDRCFVWSSLNSWGWLFTAPPKMRRNPPLRMIHVIDYFLHRIPAPRLVKLIADQGTDVVILHEEWRSDVEGMAFPHDREKLQAFIDEAHKHDIRVCLYIRGNTELTTDEDYCDWFPLYLRQDYDGLYADFGGALNIPHRQHIKQHYLKYRRIRENIGRHALYFAHCGRLSCGIGLTGNLIDGYTSGEGESGSLGKDRFLHECLSGSFLTTGSFWTAAFPRYGHKAMLPFMASTGQPPHIPLGHQYHTSSLAHPMCPGLNTLALRPLWKLWALFRDTRDVEIYNDFNCVNVFTKDDPEKTGIYLMIDKKRAVALLILSNFDSETRNVKVKINWAATGFSPDNKETYLFTPDENSPGKALLQIPDLKEYSVTLPSCSCAGFLTGSSSAMPGRITEFEKPYPALSPEAEEHLADVKKQQELRKGDSEAGRYPFIRVYVPTTHIPFVCGRAFYTIYHEIGLLDENFNFTRRGYLTLDGFSETAPSDDKLLWSLASSPWLDLRKIFPEGGHLKLGIRSWSPLMKDTFHSLIEVTRSPVPEETAQAVKLIFYNEIEPQRGLFHFEADL